MTTIGVSLALLLTCGLVISAVSILFNRRGAGFVEAAIGMLVMCAAVPLFQLLTGGPRVVTWQNLQLWLLFIVLPGAVVLGASRLGVLRTRPWLLLFAGPVLFLTTIVIAMSAYNVLFASSHPR